MNDQWEGWQKREALFAIEESVASVLNGIVDDGVIADELKIFDKKVSPGDALIAAAVIVLAWTVDRWCWDLWRSLDKGGNSPPHNDKV
jgi:hypothetical protein